MYELAVGELNFNENLRPDRPAEKTPYILGLAN